MKLAIHYPHPDGQGGAWCGAKSSRVDKTRYTCQRCVRLKTKRTWIAR